MTRRQGLIATVLLVLLASLVIGAETRRQDGALTPEPPAASAPSAPQAQAQVNEDLDVEKLHRAKRAEPIVDVFAQKIVAAPLPAVLRAPAPPPPDEPAAAAPPAPPPAPPALPFRFVARFVENGATRLLLANREKEHNVAGGETLEGTYRVDSVSDEAVTFTYLPMKAVQTLSLAPEAPR